MQAPALATLLDDELTSETLHQALAFIEAYEQSPAGCPVQGSTASQDKRVAKRQSAGRTRKRSNTKHELEQLRLDVQRLEAKLERVKKNAASLRIQDGSHPTDASQQRSLSSKNETSIWMDVALHQFNQRQQSQSTNQQLRRLLGKQLKIAKCLENALARKAHEEDLDAMYVHRLPDLRPVQHSSGDDELVFGSLLIHLQQLYAIKDVYVKQAGLEADLLAMHTERKHDPVYGTVFQTASSMPVPFSVQKTDAVIWDGLMNGHTKSRPLSNHSNNRTVVGHRVHKNYESTFQHLHTNYDLHSRTVIRKYTESNRSVYAWAVVIVQASMRLRFFAQGMMIMEPSKTVPLGATVLKNWFRVHGEQVDSSRPRDEQLIEGIMKMQTRKMVSTFQWFENSLLDESSEAQEVSVDALTAD